MIKPSGILTVYALCQQLFYEEDSSHTIHINQPVIYGKCTKATTPKGTDTNQ